MKTVQIVQTVTTELSSDSTRGILQGAVNYIDAMRALPYYAQVNSYKVTKL